METIKIRVRVSQFLEQGGISGEGRKGKVPLAWCCNIKSILNYIRSRIPFFIRFWRVENTATIMMISNNMRSTNREITATGTAIDSVVVRLNPPAECIQSDTY